MKKLLLMAMAIAAIVSCQRHVDGPGQPKPFEPATPDKSAPIFLSVGSGGTATRAGGVGIRNTQFQKGDVIGVFAATVKFTTPTTYAPDWTQKLYFANIPASYSAAGTAADTVAFTWGSADSLGALKISQFYPAKDRSIYVYAYYPYSANTTDSIKLDATTKIPSRFIDLVEGSIVPLDAEASVGDPKKNVNLIQPDYMWAVGRSANQATPESPSYLDTVRRTVRLDTLTFKHALAQLNFRLYLLDANATACKFDSLIITVPKKGSYDLPTGATKIIGTTTPVKADSVTYKITLGKGTELPAAASATDKSNAHDLLTTSPLMVLPMTSDELKGCQIRIVVDYGVDGGVALKSYYVEMKQDGIKPVKQGFYNSIYLGVGQTSVDLKCNITPWGINKPEDDSDLDVE